MTVTSAWSTALPDDGQRLLPMTISGVLGHLLAPLGAQAL